MNINLKDYHNTLNMTQFGQAGVLYKIFEIIGTTNKFFVEFGSDGTDICNDEIGWSNTTCLRKLGFDGVLIDSAPKPQAKYKVYRHHITVQNINQIFEHYNIPEIFDFLSIDIDGNDFYVWKELSSKYRPRVLCIESNFCFEKNADCVQPYDPNYKWVGEYEVGASAKAIYNLCRYKGYSYVAHCGVDGIYISDEVIEKCEYKFENINEFEKIYEGPISTPIETPSHYRSSNDLLQNIVTIPTSIGEALDKLTILEIKIDNIKDRRIEDCKNEYKLLIEKLEHVLQNPQCQHFIQYYYKILKETNLNIWNIQDRIHKNESIDIKSDYETILKENDRRFRIKEKINRFAKSSIKEQKGYGYKKCFISSHIGLGDIYWINGAIRYFSTIYNEVHVVCKEYNKTNIELMFKDDPSIILFPITNVILDPKYWQYNKAVLESQGFDVYGCGLACDKDVYDLPNSFYDDMGLDRNIRTKYFYHPPFKESKDLYQKLEQYKPYIFIHQQSATNWQANWGKARIFEYKFQTEERLILDPNTNCYTEGHKYYSVAQEFIGRPMCHYIDAIENAEELHMIESAFYALASHLNLKAKVKMCYFPFDNSERLGVFITDTTIPKDGVVITLIPEK